MEENPAVTVVMGGQWGSEGKGEICAFLARNGDYLAAIRTGGPNAGHTVTMEDGKRFKLRHVPAAWVDKEVDLYMSAGALIDKHVLMEELNELYRDGGDAGASILSRFVVDGHATIIEKKHQEGERNLGMRQKIGSTTEGIGAARAEKIMRTAKIAGEVQWEVEGGSLRYVRTGDVPLSINKSLDEWSMAAFPTVMVESTQGFGLSLEISGYYPYATSTNITPGSLLGECGISSRVPHEVVAIMRTYPIRVAGNSGPMFAETTWQELHKHSKGRAPKDGERTTVTQLVRRVSRWSPTLARRMSAVCRPDWIALTFLDYEFPDLADVTNKDVILDTASVRKYIDGVEQDCDSHVRWVATGPGKVTEVWPR